MMFSSLRFEILHRETLWDKKFDISASNFKIATSKKRLSFDFDRRHWMKNESADFWAYPIEAIPAVYNIEWEISSEIELIRARRNDYYGIVWGYDKEVSTINCFCLSADGQQCLLRSFQKNKYFINYRYSTILERLLNGKVSFTVLKTRDYYFFSLNKVVIHICPSEKILNEGLLVGYFIDSDMLMCSTFLKVDRLITQNIDGTPTKPI